MALVRSRVRWCLGAILLSLRLSLQHLHRYRNGLTVILPCIVYFGGLSSLRGWSRVCWPKMMGVAR